MELTFVQIAVARLCSDAALRQRFAADPRGVAASLGLHLNDAETIARMNLGGLDRFAATLDRKELKRVRHALPELCRVLTDRLPLLFAEFSNSRGSSERRDGDGLAIAFAAFIAGNINHDLLTRDVAKLEGRYLRLRRSWLRLGMCCVHHRLGDSYEPSISASMTPFPQSRPLIAFIFRVFGRIRIVYFPIGIAK